MRPVQDLRIGVFQPGQPDDLPHPPTIGIAHPHGGIVIHLANHQNAAACFGAEPVSGIAHIGGIVLRKAVLDDQLPRPPGVRHQCLVTAEIVA